MLMEDGFQQVISCLCMLNLWAQHQILMLQGHRHVKPNYLLLKKNCAIHVTSKSSSLFSFFEEIFLSHLICQEYHGVGG